MENINFIDAQMMHLQHPDTFDAPTKEDLDSIELNDFVKICDGDAGERFWVIVDEINGDEIKGFVDNHLISSDLHYGDLITFNKKHIYDIWKKTPKV